MDAAGPDVCSLTDQCAWQASALCPDTPHVKQTGTGLANAAIGADALPTCALPDFGLRFRLGPGLPAFQASSLDAPGEPCHHPSHHPLAFHEPWVEAFKRLAERSPDAASATT